MANHYKSKITNSFNFQQLHSTFEEEIIEMDKEISLRKKELFDLEKKKNEKIEIFKSIQFFTKSIKKEQNVEKIIEWSLFFDKVLYKNQLFACGSNNYRQIGLGEQISNVLKFTEIPNFHNKKIDLISCGKRHSFIYCGNLFQFKFTRK
jgi:alpha-tubulin suppressor-like RCC1 family protein